MSKPKNVNKTKETKNKKRHHYAWAVLFSVLFTLCLFLTMSLNWTLEHFGTISMNNILFTLSAPLEGGGTEYVADFVHTVVVPVGFVLAAAILVLILISLMTR